MPDKKILVSDFDGTITLHDFYDLICRKFPGILSAGHWQKYESGEITHFEALRRIFAEIRAEERDILDIIARMDVEPRLAENVTMLRGLGWDVVVASAGCAWYIEKILAQAGVDLEVHASPGVFFPERGLVMDLPLASPFLSREVGINKVAVVHDALNKADHVAFAGDGRPDLPAALLVKPKLRFARRWLAVKLREIGEPFQPFERWSDVAGALARGEDGYA